MPNTMVRTTSGARTSAETPKPGDPRLARARIGMVATPQMALEAAAGVARKAGFAAHILSDAIEGEAREVAEAIVWLLSDKASYITGDFINVTGGAR